MKKFLSVLAVATIALTIIMIAPSAARYIHRCRFNHCLPLRKTTSRIFPFNQYQLRRQLAREARIRKNLGNKFLFWKNYQRQISRGFIKQNYTAYKLAHRQFFPRINNVLPQPHKIAVRETQYVQDYKWDSLKKVETITQHNQEYFQNFKGNGFSTKVPKYFVKNSNGELYDATHDLTVKISRDFDLNCSGLSFQLCASKRNAKIRENMGNVKNLEQKFRLRQVNVGGENISFPSYMEKFENDGQVYFSYTNMNPLTGNIVTMTGFAPIQNEFAASNLMETLFRNLAL